MDSCKYMRAKLLFESRDVPTPRNSPETSLPRSRSSMEGSEGEYSRTESYTTLSTPPKSNLQLLACMQYIAVFLRANDQKTLAPVARDIEKRLWACIDEMPPLDVLNKRRNKRLRAAEILTLEFRSLRKSLSARLKVFEHLQHVSIDYKYTTDAVDQVDKIITTAVEALASNHQGLRELHFACGTGGTGVTWNAPTDPRFMQAVGSLSNLKVLVIQVPRSTLKDTCSASLLAAQVSGMHGLSRLVAYFQDPSPVGLQALFKELGRLEHLRDLDLGVFTQSPVRDRDAAVSFVPSFLESWRNPKTPPSLERLALGKRQLCGANGIVAIARLLTVCTGLKSLTLHLFHPPLTFGSINEDSASAFATAIRSLEQLSTLCLSASGFGGSGLSIFVGALKDNGPGHLQRLVALELHFPFQNVTPECGQQIYGMLCHRMPALQILKLDLAGNKSIGELSIQNICSAISKHTGLVSLDADFCGVGVPSLGIALGKALSCLTSLRVLNLNLVNNDLNDVGIFELAHAMLDLPRLSRRIVRLRANRLLTSTYIDFYIFRARHRGEI